MHRRFILLLLAAVAVACGHAKEGDPCEEGTPQCFDASTSLICESDGHYRAIGCPGAGGCTATTVDSTPVIQCDLRGTVSGDECPEELATAVICLSENEALVCGGDIWRGRDCPKGCRSGVFSIDGFDDPGLCDDGSS